MTYYLLKNPSIMARLQDEVRSAFKRYEEIDAATAVPLKYLKAVAQEAMRVYPPLPFALPRVVPTGGCTVDGHFLPGGVCSPTQPPPQIALLLLLLCILLIYWIVRLLLRPAHLHPACRRPISRIPGNSSRSVGLPKATLMTLMPASHFHMEPVHAWEEGKLIPFHVYMQWD